MLSKTFCSSPWFHVRLNHDGTFSECRWFKHHQIQDQTLATSSIIEFYNGDRMRKIREDFLNGKSPTGCENCYYEDSFDKLTGRTRQLTKSGIKIDDFELSLRSSPHYKNFLYSNDNKGKSNYYPTDFQIDLGNICNSGCIMCDTMSSSFLERDYKKLHKINPILFKNPTRYTKWSNDQDLLNKFVEELKSIPNIKYIHLLGGETLYDPAFYTICKKLIDADISKDIIVGTTTNGTLYDDRIEHLIKQFKEFHLGISIESVTNLNDYIRYPGKIDSILSNLEKFLALREHSDLYISLRITPNIFTVYEIDKLFEFMIDKNVAAEACNILSEPDCLRMELMPNDIRLEVKEKILKLISKNNFSKSNIVNVRQNNLIQAVNADTILDYYKFLDTYTVPENSEELRFKLVDFLKSFEKIRNNSIIDYVPRYEKFLRNYGY